MLQFGIAKELGKSLTEIRQMTMTEILGWSAYFQVLNEDQEKEMQKIRRSCLLYTSPSPRDRTRSRMPSSA